MAEASSSKQASGANTKRPSQPAPSATDDIEKLLAQEESAFQRDFEVERILAAFKLNPYAILDLEPGCTESEIKKKYRSLSLFIHPDKASHPQASEAFDRLKKAESDLSNKEKREDLDAAYVQSRQLVLKSLSLPITTEDDDPKLRAVAPLGLKERVRQQTKELLISEEVRRRTANKLTLANEGLEAKKKEDEVSQRKRKAEDDKQWEETRDQRVDSWRSFSNKKKKKAKTNVLG